MTKRRRGHGEGSVYQRADGRWEAKVDLGWVEGKRSRKSLYGRTEREVIEKKKVTERQVQLKVPLVDERRTTAHLLDWWMCEIVPGQVRRSTVISYGQKVRHLKRHLGHVRVSKLAPVHVQSFMKKMQDEGMTPRGVAYCRAVLRKALNDAMRFGLVTRNVATLVKPPQQQRVEVTPLMPSEARTLLETVKGDRLEALYSVALALGLRRGEALGLAWDDVDLDEGTLRVRLALQRIDGKLQLVEPKTFRSRRRIPLPPSCIEALRAHRVRQVEERLLAGEQWQEHGFVFTSTIGTPLEPRNLTRHFAKVCTNARIGTRRFHDLRHTCASLLLAQGVSPRVVMETLGHSQISLTMDTYAHVMPTMQREAADLIDKVLKAE